MLLFAITIFFFEKASFPFFPIATIDTFLPVYTLLIKCCVCLIILELKAPHKPLLEVIGTIKTFFISRCAENLLPESASNVALKLCKSSVNLSA